MLVLLSFGLVLVATVLLVLGLLSDDGLTLIYLSIASSVAAALVLVIALKLNKPRDQVRATAPEPLPDLEPEPQPVPAMAAATATATGSRGSDEWLAADQDDWSAGDDDWQEGEEVEFPIADYDSLSSSQILPLLPQLYADEIPVVEARERATKARPEILDRLEELGGGATGGATDADAATALEPAPAPAVAGDPLASYTEPTASSPAWDDEDDWFPIEDYESLSAAQIRPLLPELDADELVMVRDKESALGRRRSLLDEIDRLLAGGSPPVDDRPAAPARAAAGPSSAPAASKPSGTKRAAPAKKAGTAAKSAGSPRKAPAKTAGPAKRAASAKKAATPAKKASAPAKKASGPAKKASGPAKKAAASGRKAAPAKKAATPAKKGTAKKAAPAKKAAAAKRSTKR